MAPLDRFLIHAEKVMLRACAPLEPWTLFAGNSKSDFWNVFRFGERLGGSQARLLGKKKYRRWACVWAGWCGNEVGRSVGFLRLEGIGSTELLSCVLSLLECNHRVFNPVGRSSERK